MHVYVQDTEKSWITQMAISLKLTGDFLQAVSVALFEDVPFFVVVAFFETVVFQVSVVFQVFLTFLTLIESNHVGSCLDNLGEDCNECLDANGVCDSSKCFEKGSSWCKGTQSLLTFFFT